MRLISGSRTTFDLPATDSWQDRIRAFFGDEVAEALIPVDSHHEETRLRGFVADRRSAARMCVCNTSFSTDDTFEIDRCNMRSARPTAA